MMKKMILTVLAGSMLIGSSFLTTASASAPIPKSAHASDLGKKLELYNDTHCPLQFYTSDSTNKTTLPAGGNAVFPISLNEKISIDEYDNMHGYPDCSFSPAHATAMLVPGDRPISNDTAAQVTQDLSDSVALPFSTSAGVIINQADYTTRLIVHIAQK